MKGLDEMERQCRCSAKMFLMWVGADDSTVFRAAHDGSKAIRIWMGEVKKKS